MKALLCFILIFGLVSCGIFKDKQKSGETKDRQPLQRLVGRVASVPMDKRFVLVQTYSANAFEAGTILSSRGHGERTANLKVTGEKLGQFLAADIQSGSAEVGDGVFRLPEARANASGTAEESTAPAPENPPVSENQTVEEL